MPTQIDQFIPRTRINQLYTCYNPYTNINLVKATKNQVYKLIAKKDAFWANYFILVQTGGTPDQRKEIIIKDTKFATHFVPTNC